MRRARRAGVPPPARVRAAGVAEDLRAPAAASLSLEGHGSLALLALATLLLKSLIFEPIHVWPVALVCLVPWLVLIGGSTHAPRVYLYSFLLGASFFLINMRWLYAATGWGYLALAMYQAVYLPVVAIPVRHVIRRRRWPLAILFPLIWVGNEFVRAVAMSGFPWFFLSHSLSSVLTLIQISDVTGAYGVSFVVAAVNGAVADLVFAGAIGRAPGRPPVGVSGARVSVAVAVGLVLGCVLYGWIQLRRQTMSEGPRVAIIQGDFINTIYPELARDHDRTDEPGKMRIYASMIEAAAEKRPDLFLLPETPWAMYLNPEAREFFPFCRRSFALLSELAGKYQAVLVTGSGTLIQTPNDLLTDERRYNSATVFTPDGAEPQRYDKVHVVYFGETVPFRQGRFRFLYFWLNWLMPFSGPDGTIEYSLFPGAEFRRFTMSAPSLSGKMFRFAVPICYEDVMPYVSRRFVNGGTEGKAVDFLLNISNDGWFGRGIQQPQHLAICVFRAVENRVGIARSVNTGISAIIRPDGRVHDVVAGDAAKRWPGRCGYAVAPVTVDSRFTLYSRYGDWFGWGCALLWLAVFADYWVVRARTHGEAGHVGVMA